MAAWSELRISANRGGMLAVWRDHPVPALADGIARGFRQSKASLRNLADSP